MAIKEKIRAFILQNLIVFDDEAVFSDDDNIFEKGFVNSLFAMKLLGFVEEKFDITIEDDEMEIANFSSIGRIVNLINRKNIPVNCL